MQQRGANCKRVAIELPEAMVNEVTCAKVVLQVRNLGLGRRSQKRPGFSHIGSKRASLETEVAHQVGKAFRVGQADRLRVFKVHACARMILQVHADSRQIVNDGDVKRPQMRGGAYAGEHEQLRRSNGPGAENDLALGPLLGAAIALLKADNGCPLAFKIDAKRVCVRTHCEVRPRHDGMQKGSRCAVPSAVRLGYLVKAEAFLAFAVEVMIALKAGFL